MVTTDGDARLGGDDVDRAVVRWIQEQHEQRGEDWCGFSNLLIFSSSGPQAVYLTAAVRPL